ncbi:MAG: hypothetical protein LBJ00_10815 [Planctomycetaceae bacterium]|nr:hypothetical protein [Planctomycetaceae bacterium]
MERLFGDEAYRPYQLRYRYKILVNVCKKRLQNNYCNQMNCPFSPSTPLTKGIILSDIKNNGM